MGGGGGWGIWRDFLERAEAVALLRPLSTTIQTYSMASDHSLVTTLLSSKSNIHDMAIGKNKLFDRLYMTPI